MTVNKYIQNYDNTAEEALATSIVAECIQFYGHDMYYCVRSNLNYDDVMNESPNASFDSAFPIEMYIKSIDGYGGQGEFLSNIGIEIRNQIMFSVSIARWNVVAGQVSTTETITRPREGDIIYFDLDNKLMEIKKVNKYSMFYQLGTLYTYDLTCEVFEYSGENFNTGVTAIDSITQSLSIDTDENGTVINNIPVFNNNFDFNSKFANNEKTQEQGNSIVNHDDVDPFVRKF